VADLPAHRAPLTTSGLGFLTVYTFLQNWNNFLVPLLYMPGGDYRPLTLGLYLFAGGRTFDIGPLAAGRSSRSCRWCCCSCSCSDR
jgi:ABC-type glycerol-3-phosphate transport system permease component